MVRKLAILLSLLISLSGCIPVAVIMGAAVGGAIIYDNRSFKTMSDDNHAEMKATDKIRHRKDLKGKARVKVVVFNGLGLIVGSATTMQIKDELGRIVTDIPHVKRVYNEVSIEGESTTLSGASDRWLAGKVRADLLLKPGLRSTNVKIITNNGVVYLMGVVTRKQAKLAADTAREVSGVRKVVKVFEYG